MNLGNKPTIDKQERTIEVHVFDFSEQIYDKSIEIAFIEYLRSQQKFESLDDLKAQIEKDCDEAKLKIGLL
ncbi:MAG: riboflavin kinase [Bacteroidales bacterium]|nr:riboflavin kinase [Bacteroidales bacterium]